MNSSTGDQNVCRSSRKPGRERVIRGVSSSQAALASVSPLGRVPSPDQPGAPVPSRRLQTLGHPGKSQAVIREDPRDWDYGDYEGLATPDIRASTPGWNMWRDGFPGGEGPRR